MTSKTNKPGKSASQSSALENKATLNKLKKVTLKDLVPDGRAVIGGVRPPYNGAGNDTHAVHGNCV